MSFRAQILDHEPLTRAVGNAKRAIGRVYHAVGERDWVTAQMAILAARVELERAFAYIEQLAD